MTIDMNQVQLYHDANDPSKFHTLRLDEWLPGKIHSISGTSIQDRATKVRYRLPPGRVVTLAEHVAYPPLPHLSGLGKTIDLIGDGQEHELSLSSFVMNDVVSAFFYRDVDLDRGYLELFSDADYKGVRQIVFMSEWSAGSLVKISDWHMQDRLSSVRWIDLDDTLHIELYEHSNGTGKRYQNILRRAARGTPEGLTNLKGQSVNDIISAFKIFQSPPEIEKIKEFTVDIERSGDDVQRVLRSEGDLWGGDLPGKYTASFTEKFIENTTVTVQQSHHAGGSLSYSYSWGVGGLTSSYKHSLTVTLTYDYTHTATDSASKTTEQTLVCQEEYPIPANSSWSFTWTAYSGKMNATFTTRAVRWYKLPFYGTTLDANGLYKRVEMLTGRFKGVLCTGTESTFQSKPLGS